MTSSLQNQSDFVLFSLMQRMAPLLPRTCGATCPRRERSTSPCRALLEKQARLHGSSQGQRNQECHGWPSLRVVPYGPARLLLKHERPKKDASPNDRRRERSSYLSFWQVPKPGPGMHHGAIAHEMPFSKEDAQYFTAHGHNQNHVTVPASSSVLGTH